MDDKKLVDAGRLLVAAMNSYKKGNIKPAKNLSAEEWLIHFLDEQLEYIKKE